MHADYSDTEARKIFESVGRLSVRRGRFIVLNTWRNIDDEPIECDTLAVCDARSVAAPDDYILFNFTGPEGHLSETYRLSSLRQDRHRWHYFPAMTRDEVLLFMQFDSDIDSGGARVCFHTSFRPLTAAATTRPRQSIETRCIAVFPDHTPDTLLLDDASISAASASAIISALQHSKSWDAKGKAWLLSMAKQIRSGRKGVAEEVVRMMVEHGAKEGHHGLKGASRELKRAVRERLRPRLADIEAVVLSQAVEGDAPAAAASSSDDPVAAAVEGALTAVKHPEYWPPESALKMKERLWGEGPGAALDFILDGHKHLKRHRTHELSPEQRRTAYAMIMASDFASIATSSFALS